MFCTDITLSSYIVNILHKIKISQKFLKKSQKEKSCSADERRFLIEGSAKDGSVVKDELTHYQDSRYIGATEACWRIQEFPLRFRYPPVEILAIHLEEQQNVFLKDSTLTKEEMKEIANNNKTSQLTKFFELNNRDKKANEYTYDNILQHFRWDKSKKDFVERKLKLSKNLDANREDDDSKSNQIGRIPVI